MSDRMICDQVRWTGLTASSYLDTNAVSGQTNFYKVAATDACGASVSSAALGVDLPLPALGLSVSVNALAITWPAWASDWSLSAATNLTPPVLWWPVTNQVATNNGMFNVTLPIGSGIQFFRLVSP